MYYITTATKKIRALSKRIRAVQGGTSASKTIGILQNLIDFAQTDTTPTLTSVVSDVFPHLKRGARLDFLNIMQQQKYFKESRWNKTDSQYTFETKSVIEFFSADDSNKVRGPRRDRLFVNEADKISFDTFDQLEVRTKQFTFLDWNPTSEFWFYTEVLPKRTDVDHIILNYLDNEAIPPEIKQSIESRRNRPGWWKVYGLGELAEIEGKIYNGWELIDAVPFGARLERYGLNFGYTGHPAAIVAVYYWNGAYILDEIAYGPGLLNRMLADTIISQPKKALTIADSAEPKSIDEIKEYGVSITATTKGADSRRYGISVVQDQQIYVTRRSKNVWREYLNYLWKYDTNGKMIEPNEPEEPFHYSMDAIRYAITSLAHIKRREEFVRNLPRIMRKPKPNQAR
jgi:phage terminase large subunit